MKVEFDALTRLFHVRELLYGEIRKAFEDQDLTSTEILILHAIQHRGKERKAGELASELSLPLSTLTGIIDKMIRKGIVVREQDPQDRRVVLIKLNPDYRRESEVCLKTLHTMLDEIVRDTPPAWFHQFNENLLVLEELLERRAGQNEQSIEDRSSKG